MSKKKSKTPKMAFCKIAWKQENKNQWAQNPMKGSKPIKPKLKGKRNQLPFEEHNEKKQE